MAGAARGRTDAQAPALLDPEGVDRVLAFHRADEGLGAFSQPAGGLDPALGQQVPDPSPVSEFLYQPVHGLSIAPTEFQAVRILPGYEPSLVAFESPGEDCRAGIPIESEFVAEKVELDGRGRVVHVEAAGIHGRPDPIPDPLRPLVRSVGNLGVLVASRRTGEAAGYPLLVLEYPPLLTSQVHPPSPRTSCRPDRFSPCRSPCPRRDFQVRSRP